MTTRVKAQAKHVYGRNLSSAKGAICTRRFPSHNLVYSTNLPNPGDVYTAVDYGNTMVHLASSDIPGVPTDVTETKDTRGMGIT